MNSDNNPIISTISSLKEIVTIVTGLTITNAILQLMTTTSTATASGLGTISFQTLLLFILLVMNVIRFYHGNMRHLDTTYTAEWGKGSSGDLKLSGGRKTAIDFFVIFSQSLVFAFISFLLRVPLDFFALFVALLVADVVWFLGVYQFTSDRKAFDHQKQWTLNNTISVFALLIAISSGAVLDPIVHVYLLWGILVLNTLIDFTVSWDFYFPKFVPAEK